MNLFTEKQNKTTNSFNGR